MEIDEPEVVAEVEAVCARYEQALNDDDVPVLQELFRNDPRTLRYGVAEILYGWQQIADFRANRGPLSFRRTLEKVVITTFGRDFATANCEFRRLNAPGRLGRQSQTWVRMPEGWRVVAAHVSFLEETPAATAPAGAMP